MNAWITLLLLSGSAPDAVFQYAVPVQTNRGESAAYLWVPPEAREVRGVLIGGMTLMEREFANDARIRTASASERLAIVFLKCGLGSADPQVVLETLAKVSGYREISVAPLFFVGHSAGGPHAKACAIRMASRCFGLVQYRGGVPGGQDPLPPGVPALMMVGQFDEFGGTMRDATGRETWAGGRDALAAFRAQDERNLASIAVEPGAGHFAWSDRNAAYLALFIRKAAQARIPASWPIDAREPVALKEIDPRSGWLTDLAIERKDANAPAAYEKYGGEKAKAAWHFDQEMAEATIEYHTGISGKKDQFIAWEDPHWVDAGARFFFTRIEWVGEGQSFAVHPVYADAYPSQHEGRGPRWLRAGEAVGHSSTPILVKPVSGPVVATGTNTLRIRYDALAPATEGSRVTFMAYSAGDAEYRYTEQVGMMPRGFQGLTKGKDQTIAFPPPDPLKVNGPPVKLRATSDAGLPVEYYVAYGPAAIEDSMLKIAELPVRATFPIAVKVVAYQFGQGVEPFVKTAAPVERLMEIEEPAAGHAAVEMIERWGCFEASYRSSKTYGNPFSEVDLRARFECDGEAVTVRGFPDGDGIWKVRCMPVKEGRWTFETRSNDPGLDGKRGEFLCGSPAKGNRGPVRVAHTWHFEYADGTPYFQVGTTCYAWIHQTETLQEKTLDTLAASPFNKIRFCIFPKSYAYNRNEPPFFPFERAADGSFDFTRPDPISWRHLERRILDLQRLGIEADLILWHPYDRWGFAEMGDANDDRYLRLCIARLGAFRNVWWSLANEYDLMAPRTTVEGHRGDKTMDDWDRFFRILQEEDPSAHLRGIHNCRGFYDHSKSWVTHASIQSSDLASGPAWREKYRKPIVYDECRYEGDIPQGWGHLTAEEMVHHFWLGTIGGCYVGHGETYKHPEDILWWSKGGVLHGRSPARIAFLRRIMETAPFRDMAPDARLSPGNATLCKPGEIYLIYCLDAKPAAIDLPGDRPYKVDGIDTWDMTIASLGTAQPGRFGFTPPRVPYLVRIAVYGPGEWLRPEAKAEATPIEGAPPLTVAFRGPADLACRWEFGDGAASAEPNPIHTYEESGLYTAILTVTDKAGASATAHVQIAVEILPDRPIVRVGSRGGDTSPVHCLGDVKRLDDGAFDFGEGEPWKWVAVGDGPIEAIEGLRSFSICGWIKASSLIVGSGGNRIAFNLNYDRSGLDLVHLGDGRLRLAVNEWPDGIANDSSPGKIVAGQWVFFAVAYDGTSDRDNVRWYFGDESTPARLDRTTTYARGATGRGSGPLTIGNYNPTIHQHGLDRQIRGALRDVAIFGSRITGRGALGEDAIRRQQGIR